MIFSIEENTPGKTLFIISKKGNLSNTLFLFIWLVLFTGLGYFISSFLRERSEKGNIPEFLYLGATVVIFIIVVFVVWSILKRLFIKYSIELDDIGIKVNFSMLGLNLMIKSPMMKLKQWNSF